MANRLKMAQVQSILTLHERGWSQRRIAVELDVDRETVSRYVDLARQASQRAADAVSNPANAPISRAGSSALSKPASAPISAPGRASDCDPWREIIQVKQAQGLSAKRIHQDLVGEHGATVGYDSVRRFLRRLGWVRSLPFRRMECAAGEEAQVDFGTMQTPSGGNYDLDIGTGTTGVSGTGKVFIDGTGAQWNIQGSSGRINIGTNSGAGSSGTLSITNGGMVSVQSLVQIGQTGSLIVGPGSALSATSVANEGSLRIDGTYTGDLSQVKGLLSGTGTITGQLTTSGPIAPGDSPGTLTVGSLFMYPGTTFNFEINSVAGMAGGMTGWNLLSSLGSVTLASATANSYTIHLESLDQSNNPGNLFDFDPTQNYHWTFMTGATIGSFYPGSFQVDTSGFSNPVHGQFNVSEVGNSLVLNYVVPEPNTFLMAVLGLGMLAAGRFSSHIRRGRVCGACSVIPPID